MIGLENQLQILTTSMRPTEGFWKKSLFMTSKVLIAVQARSTSERLPNKWKVLINGQTVMDRVIGAIQSSASYINNGRGDVQAQTCLVVPFGDEIAKKHGHHITVFEGPEDDVLQRYHNASESINCDYVVRITGDCPMIPAFVITKHILTAEKHGFDYVTNTRDNIRTCPDGHDVEVISKRLLRWCHETATAPSDREHVTTFIKSNMPDWATEANIISYTDDSHLKLSIDTSEDVEFVRTYDSLMNRKIKIAKDTAKGFFRI